MGAITTIEQDAKKVPPWVWIALAAGGGVWLLMGRSSSGANTAAPATSPSLNPALATSQPASTVPVDTSGSDGSATNTTSDGTSSPYPVTTPPAGTTSNPSTVTPSPAQTTFQDWYFANVPSGYGQPGTIDPWTGQKYTVTGDQQAVASLPQLTEQQKRSQSIQLQQFASSDPGFMAWIQQGSTFQPGGSNYGNWNAWNQYNQQGQQYLVKYGNLPLSGGPVQPATVAGGGSSYYKQHMTKAAKRVAVPAHEQRLLNVLANTNRRSQYANALKSLAGSKRSLSSFPGHRPTDMR